MSLLVLVEAIVGLAAFLGALSALWRWFGIGTLKTGTENFLSDWNGEPARPGRAAIPSFPERLASLEKEFKPNGGGSLRDLANQASVRSQEAADATAEIAAALGRADNAGRAERARTDAKVDEIKEDLVTLTRALDGFARDTRERERRYVEALRDSGVADLTGITEDLNERELDGDQ